MIRGLSTAVVAALIAIPAAAEAQVYKYKKKDGSIVYTDSLAQLPSARRAYYNKLEKDRKERLKRLEKARGKDTVDKERMEAERARILKMKIEEEERQRRLAAIDAQLKAVRAKRTARTESRSKWTKRINDAKSDLKKKIAEFEKVQESYNSVAIKGGYGLFPGQQEQMQKDKKKMDALEKEIDDLNLELTVRIPEEARRAGVPPGWLR